MLETDIGIVDGGDIMFECSELMLISFISDIIENYLFVCVELQMDSIEC